MTWQVPRLMLGDNHAASLAERSAEVDVGQIGGPAAFIRVFPLTGIKARERATALGDFETTVVRMATGTPRPWPVVGSGAVEEGCQVVVGQRLRCPACAGPATAPPAC